LIPMRVRRGVCSIVHVVVIVLAVASRICIDLMLENLEV
jgi:hypothetical protein